jgi:hypothetical protein|tara:strand:- start:343 stop:552 length:210 start_codon:yes stop_codon:yes gene_type:complete
MSDKSTALKVIDRIAIGLVMLLFVSCAVIAYRQHQLDEVEVLINKLEAAALNIGESLENMLKEQGVEND